MASSSTQPDAAEIKSILTPVMTLEGHEPWNDSHSENEPHSEYKFISYIAYFPDGKQMISRSRDKTIRRWDLREGKEIEKAREVYEDFINAVMLSRDGRWFVTATISELKVSEVETGIVRTFHGLPTAICIDISTDSALVAGGSSDGTRTWSLDTGKLVAGPFNISRDCSHLITSLRLSEDSRKLAVLLKWGRYLQVWDVRAQKLLAEKSAPSKPGLFGPVFWTTKDKSIVAAFCFIDDPPTGTAYDPSSTIYELDPSTLKIVGAPFQHTSDISDLALSSDCVLLIHAN
ncbi:YVTN repeat-like/Quino protein amine dehydrogenase [Suillus hirtellus]|nr:YVTN repeat-like/Quino protein amine dehydrogenase [Suillus hirtellus]